MTYIPDCFPAECNVCYDDGLPCPLSKARFMARMSVARIFEELGLQAQLRIDTLATGMISPVATVMYDLADIWDPPMSF